MTAPRGLPEHLARQSRCLVMGILNVTPDSFSDGGRWLDPDAAVEHGVEMMAAGADFVDVGGESTRPGAARVTAGDEQHRVLPVIRQLVAAGVPVSIDTLRASTAYAALEAGVMLVNDVSGGVADSAMPAVVAESSVPYVAMHWRGHSDTMEERAVYSDVVGEVCAELHRQVRALEAAGVDPDRVALDPGLGFAKNAEHNWAVLRGLDALLELGHPLLLGASRKRFLGELLAAGDGTPASPERRDGATAALTAIAAVAGAWAVRVHDVSASADAVRVAAALVPPTESAGHHARHSRPEHVT